MPLTIVKQDVTDVAAELATVVDPIWNMILPWVNEFDLEQIGETVDAEKNARVFLAAHIATIIKKAKNGAAGPVTGESAGGVRRSYGLIATATSAGSLGSTFYGQLFLDIISMSNANGPMLV